MKTFIAVCAKNGQRVELSVIKNTLDEARTELHHQGYSIIEIKESDGGAVEQKSGSLFFFEIIVEGKKKGWQIRSGDALSAYTKLVDGLHYEVVTFYGDANDSEEDRGIYFQKVRQMYQERKGRSTEKKEEPNREKKRSMNEEPTGDSWLSVLAREVAKYHALIERIGTKVEEMLAQYSNHFDEDRIFRLKELVTTLRQLKNITNPEKLKLIGEAALEKIGQLEIELLEKNLVGQREGFLKETNVLLKKLGSSKKITLAEDDFLERLKFLWKKLVETVSGAKKEEGSVSWNVPQGASNEFLYFKNVRELRAYVQRRSEVRKELLKGIFTIRWERRSRLNMKLRLINQNIELLTNRINNRPNSYVRIKRGVSAYSEAFFYFVRSIGDFLLYSLLIYSAGYSAYSLFAVSRAPHWYVRTFAIFAFASFCLKQTRSWGSFSTGAILGAAYVFVLSVNF